MYRKFEKTPVNVYPDSRQASREVAQEIAKLIKVKQAKDEHAVLGLATGSTPTSVYAELVRLHKEEGLSFKNVVTFNLDEYFPMAPDALQSYVRFMNEHLFDHIDIDKSKVHVPDGTLDIKNVQAYCVEYEEKIKSYGGLDLQVLGIGRTGHIGFNEPGSTLESKTRLITLDGITIRDAASDFFHEDNVPRRAITMGVGTIMEAKQIIMMAWGEGKSPIIQKTVEGPVTELIPATYLQQHPNAQIVLDEAAAAKLVRHDAPWLVGFTEWTDKMIRKAVVWLCQKVNKPILKLTDDDYMENGMADLLTQHGSAYDINIKIFNELQRTITGCNIGSRHHKI